MVSAVDVVVEDAAEVEDDEGFLDAAQVSRRCWSGLAGLVGSTPSRGSGPGNCIAAGSCFCRTCVGR